MKRRRFSGAFKGKVALESIKNDRTISEISNEYKVHPNQVSQWKKQLLDGIPELFSNKSTRRAKEREELESELYRQIGQLKVEIDWLKKKHGTVIR